MNYEKQISILEKTIAKYERLVAEQKNEDIKKGFQKTLERMKERLKAVRYCKNLIERIEYDFSKKAMYGNINALLLFIEHLYEKYPNAYVYEINFHKELEEYKRKIGSIDVKVIKG